MFSGPIQNHKEICSAMCPEGWSYIGFHNGFYCFRKGNFQDGFIEVKAFEEDLTKESLDNMFKYGYTRV